MIVQKEKLAIDEPALKLITRLADGSVRDAQSILSQVVAFSSDAKITEAEVEEIVGAASLERVLAFLQLLSMKDLKAAIIYINSLQDQEYQVQSLLKLSVELLEKVLILQANPDFADRLNLDFSLDQVKELQALAQKMSPRDAKLFARGFMEVMPQTKKSVLPTLPVELVIMEVLGEEKE
jgi:DNA polymerase-3 subunit gamma/tau